MIDNLILGLIYFLVIVVTLFYCSALVLFWVGRSILKARSKKKKQSVRQDKRLDNLHVF